MVATQVPLIDMNPDEKTAIYIAALEAKLVAMTLNEMKYRTLLEMLTGQEWEELSTDIGASRMKKIATNATARRLARSMEQAEKIVDANIAAANENSKASESS